jgi:hypothetical protein
MDIETPEKVSNRVFHEEQIPPGSICRRWKRDDDEWSPTPWFVVVTPPRESKHGSEYIRVVWLTGESEGQRDRFFLGDLGVKPPYRGVTEKHEMQVPEKYLTTSWTARVVAGFVEKII